MIQGDQDNIAKELLKQKRKEKANQIKEDSHKKQQEEEKSFQKNQEQTKIENNILKEEFDQIQFKQEDQLQKICLHDDEEEIDKEIFQENQIQFYKCKFCGKQFSNQSRLSLHEKENHAEYNSQNIEEINKKSEDQKLQKAFTCKICKKHYTQNSGIWHHQREKHGQYDPNTVEIATQSIQSQAKRGRPKLIKSENEEKTQEEIGKELMSFLKFDKELDLLQNDHIKMILSLIIEFGETLKSYKKNLFIQDYDDENPFQQEFNDIYNEWPELKDQILNLNQNNNNNLIQRFINFVGKVIQDLKPEVVQQFILIFKEILEIITANNNYQSINLSEITEKIQNQILNQTNKNKFSNFLEAHENSKQKGFEKNKKNIDNESTELQDNDSNIDLNKFLMIFIHCTIGYAYDQENIFTGQYFGN